VRSDAPDGSRLPDYSTDEVLNFLEESAALKAPGAFLMYGVPRSRVVDIIREAGGDLVHVEEDDRAQPEWAGYKYFVRV